MTSSRRLVSQFPYILLPYPSSAGASPSGESISCKRCGSRACYVRSMLNALPDEMFSALAISSKRMRAASSIIAFTRGTNSSLHLRLFFTLPLLLKVLFMWTRQNMWTFSAFVTRSDKRVTTCPFGHYELSISADSAIKELAFDISFKTVHNGNMTDR